MLEWKEVELEEVAESLHFSSSVCSFIPWARKGTAVMKDTPQEVHSNTFLWRLLLMEVPAVTALYSMEERPVIQRLDRFPAILYIRYFLETGRRKPDSE